VKVALTDAAKADVRRILRTTRDQFGAAQVPRYRALISEARRQLSAHPYLGHGREDLPPHWRLFHIARRGRPARHFFLYVVNDAEQRVVVLRVLHDAMDIPAIGPGGQQ
jgi:plasmid stabilization system protein ParE